MATHSTNVIRRALLVIHGIGQQRKYQTLSEFTLGLIRHGLPGQFREKGREIKEELDLKFNDVGIELFEHGKVTLGNGLQVGVDVYKSARDFDSRVCLKVPAGPSGEPSVEVDIYESYWAYITGGRTNVFRVIWWLILTTFRSVSNVFEPRDPISSRPRDEGGDSVGGGRRVKDFVREFARFLIVLVLLLAILYGLYSAGKGILESFVFHAEDFWRDFTPWYFIFTIISFLYIFSAWQYLVRLFAGGMKAHWVWVIFLGAVLVGLGWLIHGNIKPILGEIKWLFFAVFLIVIAQKVFVDYLGDVEIYVSGNDIGRNRQVRREIIGRTRDKLQTILGRKAPKAKAYDQDKPYYDEVIVIGHSLGSVIAYDVLCKALRIEGGSKAQQARQRVKHFFTVGSPLDKIWCFFRDRASADNPFYQGILGKLKGVKASGITNSPLAELEWTNMWSFTDFVSGGLEEYGDLVENIHLNSMLFPPFVNHVRYFVTRDVMSRLGDRVF